MADPTSVTAQDTYPADFTETAHPQVPRRKYGGRKVAAAQEVADIKAQSASATDGSVVNKPRVNKPRRVAGPTINQIPSEILNDLDINSAISSLLPSNYNFEIHKTIWHIRKNNYKRVALQMPEGLLLFACTISDIIEAFCLGTETVIMGDVTYGACCIDDFTARALECDFLVHYAHSCLIPVDVTKIKTLYVFVTIGIDSQHLVSTIQRNFSCCKRLAIVGTIQFNATIHGIKPTLESLGYSIAIPQITPLSRGEILGCTSPTIDHSSTDALIYIGDGRFHLESAMIQNPNLMAYRYDPYSRKFTHETYNHLEMHSLRRDAIAAAKNAKKFGLILGTLGRQGNPDTLLSIEEKLNKLNIPFIRVLLSEIFPGKLAHFEDDIDAWVQVACPRLSIDWGYAFPKPLLSPYEALVALGEMDDWGDVYPMDFYGAKGLGRMRLPR